MIIGSWMEIILTKELLQAEMRNGFICEKMIMGMGGVDHNEHNI